MKRSLYLKFILTYVALAVAMLAIVMTLGSFLLEKQVIRDQARLLYSEANEISKANILRYISGHADAGDFLSSLRVSARAQDLRIQLLDVRGGILLDTDTGLHQAEPAAIEGFNAASFGPQYYEISDFFGQFGEEGLHVMAPVTSGMTTRGYVVFHENMARIYALRDTMLKYLLLFALFFLVLSFLILAQFTVTVYRPLIAITEGTMEFASGNLKHRIEVNSSDEIGDLANSMNVMAQELERNNEYQRQFVANVSHDFRSPLTSIKGFTEAMIDGTIPPEMHGRYLGIIGQEADRLENLTQGIMEMNRADISEALLSRSDFDLHTVIRDTAALFEGSCQKKHITIDLVLTGETLYVNADKERIKQVLYNLLDNAVKFSERGSSVKIETDEKHGRCYVSVKDYGCGIAKDDLPRIWNRFYKTDYSRGKDRRGSGLGLAIVKEIIKAHGQNINVMSTEGAGTEFIFTLALSEEEAIEALQE